jgi:hypothetical protein
MQRTYLQLALDENKDLVSIYEVIPGIDCNCKCPGCGSGLIAKNKGKVPGQALKPGQKIAHFAHAGPECTWANESAIHLLAKEVLEKTKTFLLPDLIYRGRELANRKLIQFDEVLNEERIGKNDIQIQPDLILIKNKKELYIEFFKTHAVDNAKIVKLKRLDQSCVEVDINDLQPLQNGEKNFEGMRRILEREVISKSWLHNSQQENLYEELLQKERKEEHQEKTIAEEKTETSQSFDDDFEEDFLDTNFVRPQLSEEELNKRERNRERNSKWKQNLLEEGYKFLKTYKGRGDLWGYDLIYCPKAKDEYRRVPINKDNCEKCSFFRANIFGWKEGVYVACGYSNKMTYQKL